MANYLTIEQASKATGKSTRTIRRLCYNENSKDFVTHDEKNRLLIDLNYLAQHYPLVNTPKPVKPNKNDNGKYSVMSKDKTIDNVKPEETDNLHHRIALLEQEVKHKDELFHKISQEKERQILEKDRRIEDLNRALLLLGEGMKKESITDQEQPDQGPAKKKRWWRW